MSRNLCFGVCLEVCRCSSFPAAGRWEKKRMFRNSSVRSKGVRFNATFVLILFFFSGSCQEGFD